MLPEFTRTSGLKVATGSGASQGTGPQTIAAQLARGVPADVVILSREGLNELIAANRITAGTDVDLAQVPLGVAVRAGTTKPDVSTVETFRQTLLKASSVAVPGKHQRHLADEGAFSATRHRRKNRRQGGTARLRCGRHGGRRNGGYCGHAGQRNRICARCRVRGQHRAGDSVRSDIFRRRGCRHGSARRVQTADRVSRLGARVRSNQEQRHGAAHALAVTRLRR